MFEVELGPLLLVVDGPALCVRERCEGGREWLRFDLPVEQALALARGLPEQLARAGRADALTLVPGALDAALSRVEPALRNPPADLDGLDVATLRRRRGEKWQHFGPEPLAAWVADMDFPVAEPIRRVLQLALDLGDLGYPVNPRPSDLPTVFAERAARRFGWQLQPRQVEVITDVVQGIFTALSVWSEPGDGVLVQTPVYPPFLGSVRETGRRLVTCDLVRGANGYAIDFDALRRAADPGVRILLLCHPHNPTGRAFSRAELEGIAALALERDLVVVSDEIHADLVYPGRMHLPFATLGPEVERRTVTLTSATKAFNIAGLRCAVAVYGSEELKRRFRTLPRHLRGGVNTFGLAATDAAWRHADPWLAQVLAYLDANRRRVADVVRERMPGVAHLMPEATYLAWLDCRALELEPDPQRFFLERAGVALSDGAPFGDAGKGFVRLNFATSRAILDEILERMAKAVQEAAR